MKLYRVRYLNRFTGDGPKWVTYVSGVSQQRAAAIKGSLERLGYGKVEVTENDLPF